jgi:hypothetical protein
MKNQPRWAMDIGEFQLGCSLLHPSLVFILHGTLQWTLLRMFEEYSHCPLWQVPGEHLRLCRGQWSKGGKSWAPKGKEKEYVVGRHGKRFQGLLASAFSACVFDVWAVSCFVLFRWRSLLQLLPLQVARHLTQSRLNFVPPVFPLYIETISIQTHCPPTRECGRDATVWYVYILSLCFVTTWGHQ